MPQAARRVILRIEPLRAHQFDQRRDTVRLCDRLLKGAAVGGEGEHRMRRLGLRVGVERARVKAAGEPHDQRLHPSRLGDRQLIGWLVLGQQANRREDAHGGPRGLKHRYAALHLGHDLSRNRFPVLEVLVRERAQCADSVVKVCCGRATAHEQLNERLDAPQLGDRLLVRLVVCGERPDRPRRLILDLVRPLLDEGAERRNGPRARHGPLDVDVALRQTEDRPGGLGLHLRIGGAEHRDDRRDHARIRHGGLVVGVAKGEVGHAVGGQRAEARRRHHLLYV